MKKFSDFYEIDEKKINEASEKIYQYLKENVNNEGELDEGLFGSIIGGIAGATLGPAIGKAICKALGISSGMLYNLLTSRAFTTMVASYIGYKQ